jgi:hypothetical protein
MDLIHSLPFLSTAITLAFAGAVFWRYLKGRRKHTLMWTIGLLLYAAGTFAEAFLAVAWSPFVLRLWYLCGAMLTAAWLAQGSFYLLIRKPRVADALLAGLALLSLIAAGLVFTAPMSDATFRLGVPISTQYKEILTRTGPMVGLTVFLNIYGTLGLVGGAAYSAWLFWRKRVLFNRMLGNIFIAAGALFPAMAGTLIRVGLGDWLYVSELIGAAVMFFGFTLATQPAPVEKSKEKPATLAAGA